MDIYILTYVLMYYYIVVLLEIVFELNAYLVQALYCNIGIVIANH